MVEIFNDFVQCIRVFFTGNAGLHRNVSRVSLPILGEIMQRGGIAIPPEQLIQEIVRNIVEGGN